MLRKSRRTTGTFRPDVFHSLDLYRSLPMGKNLSTLSEFSSGIVAGQTVIAVAFSSRFRTGSISSGVAATSQSDRGSVPGIS